MLHWDKMRAELMLFGVQFSPFSVYDSTLLLLSAADEVRLSDNGSTGCLDTTIIQTGME